MLKKLGVRWMPGLPFLTEPKVSNAFHKGDDVRGGQVFTLSSSKEMALVLVLAQDSNVKIEKGK